MEDAPETISKAHAGRVILRNIHFDTIDKHIRKDFGKYGQVKDIQIPMKQGSKLNRGFAFIEYATRDEAMEAISKVHNSKWKGRTLAMELSVPKESYENKIDKLVQNTHLEKKEAQLPKNLREEKHKHLEEKKKREDERKEYLEKNAKKIKKQEKKKAKKQKLSREAQKEEEAENPALFVRNIGFETTQEKFKEFMDKFGTVQYAVLCKAQDKNVDADSGVAPHKGTGFVKFTSKDEADQLVQLSAKVENQMDEERKNARLKKASQDSLVNSLSILKNEIELDGRRLVIKPSVTKAQAA